MNTIQEVIDVDQMAQHIRTVDGSNSMGAGALAESICTWLASRRPSTGALSSIRNDAAIAALVRSKMASGNSVPVERCTIKASEIAEVEAIQSSYGVIP